MLAATLDFFLEDIFRLPIRKVLDPNDPQDFAAICSQLAKATAGLAQADEAKALKKALAMLDVDWKGMSGAAKAKVVLASKQAVNPVKTVLPKIEEHFEANAIKLGIQTKGATKKTFGFSIAPDLSAVQLKTLHAVALSQGNYVRDEYGKRSDVFSMKAKQIVTEELAKGTTQKEIVDRLHKDLGAQQFNRSRAYWAVVSSAFANRSRTFVNLSSYQEAGITSFRFDSVLDERTSHVCRFMHGRDFPVAFALGAYADSEKKGGDVKVSQPWVQQASDDDGNPTLYVKNASGGREHIATVTESGMGKVDETGKFKGASNTDLEALGVMSPPLHGHCRSSILPVKEAHTVTVPSSFELEPTGPEPEKPSAPPPAAPAVVPEQEGFAFGPGGISMKPLEVAALDPTEPPVKVMVPLAAKKDAALEKLNALSEDSIGSVPNPAPVKKHPGFTWDGDKLAIVQQAIAEGVATKKLDKKVELLHSVSDDVDKAKVAMLIKSPMLLLQEKITVVKVGTDYLVIEGHEALAAANLLSKWKLPVTEVNLKNAEKELQGKAKAAALLPKAPPIPPTPVPPPAPPPPPPPAPLAPALSPADIMHAKTTRPGGGSNNGAFYMGTDGAERFVKLYGDPAQAHGEVLANSLYKALGFESPDSVTWKDPTTGKQAYASKLIEGKQLGMGATKAQAKEFFKGFAADVLVGNWDAAGKSCDNAFLLPNGKVMRIDNGGCFLMRAMGSRKPDSVLNGVAELEGFFPSSTISNPGYHKLAKAAGYDSVADFKDDFKAQVVALTKLRDKYGGWSNFVSQYAPGMPAGPDRDKIVQMLEQRHLKLQDHVVTLFTPAPPPPPPGPKLRPLPGPNAVTPYRAPAIQGTAPKKGLKSKDLPETTVRPEWINEDVPRTLPWGESRPDYQARAARAVAKIKPEEKSAVRSFSGSSYGPIRQVEATGRGSAEMKAKAKALSEMAERAHPEPCTAYRGVQNISQELLEKWISHTPDEPFRLGFHNNGATSSSAWHAGISVCRSAFMGGPHEPREGSGYKVLFQIHQKSGVPIETISAVGSGETEILLPKDAEFRVLRSARWEGRQRIVVIELEEI